MITLFTYPISRHAGLSSIAVRSSPILDALLPSLARMIIFITLLCILLFPTPVRAEPLSLSISPPLVEITTQTDRSITKEYTLHNLGERVSVTPQLFLYSSDGMASQPLDPPDPWIQIVTEGISWNDPFVLKAQEERRIVVSLRIARSLEEKDYYRALVFSTNPAPTAQFSQSLIQERITSILLMTVSSSGLASGNIEFSKINVPDFIDSFTPVTMDMELKNTTDTYSRISGTIILNGPVGKSVFSIIPTVLLAGESKHILSTVAGNGNSGSTVQIPGLYLGQYHLETAVTVGEGGINIHQKSSFYAIPWKICLGVAGFYAILRLKRKWQHNGLKALEKKITVDR